MLEIASDPETAYRYTARGNLVGVISNGTAILDAYEGIDSLEFGSDYIIPKPMDPRLLSRVSSAVARAAIDSGVVRVATMPSYPE